MRECDGQTDAENMNYKLGQECTDREVSLRSSRERDNNTAHDKVHRYAVESPEEQRTIQTDWHTATNRIVDRGRNAGNQEV